MGTRGPSTHAGHHLTQGGIEIGAGTAVYVSFRTDDLDLSWIPDEGEVIVVHNDDSLDPGRCDHPNVRHLQGGGNIGFGRAVNLALPQVTTERVALVNPDTRLSAEHWPALMAADSDEVVALPLIDGEGRPTSMASPYPTPASLVLTAARIGRWLPRGGAARRVLAPLLGTWGRAHRDSLARAAGSWPATERWASGAAASFDTARLQEVGGFADTYFLYLEDVDLCGRLARRYPDLRVRLAKCEPGVHTVGGSAGDPAAHRRAQRHYTDSAIAYASAQRGPVWRAAGAMLSVRRWWLRRGS